MHHYPGSKGFLFSFFSNKINPRSGDNKSEREACGSRRSAARCCTRGERVKKTSIKNIESCSPRTALFKAAFEMFLFNRRSRNESDLIEILQTLVTVIKQHVVHAFLETLNTASILLRPHHTRIVSGFSWPKANDTLTRVDGIITR